MGPSIIGTRVAFSTLRGVNFFTRVGKIIFQFKVGIRIVQADISGSRNLAILLFPHSPAVRTPALFICIHRLLV